MSVWNSFFWTAGFVSTMIALLGGIVLLVGAVDMVPWYVGVPTGLTIIFLFLWAVVYMSSNS